ncbi:MAG: glycosyltransferase family 2 protein [Bdellovibrionales bacterium]
MKLGLKLIAVVIPCYKVRDKILSVIAGIGAEVSAILVVDDACPEGTGAFVTQNCKDDRVTVITKLQNSGVGGAVVAGYVEALKSQAKVVVKIDGDGQLDPRLISKFSQPILDGKCDYVKGNRFYSWEMVSTMPRIRLFGNSVLSFISKLVSGYWSVMDPTNGYTAISSEILKLLPLEKIDQRYFFESDMLFRLGTIRAKVLDLPMTAVYSDENSSLSIFNTAFTFPLKFGVRFFKRIFYNYFLRDFNMGSMYIISGVLLVGFGFCFGVWHWLQSTQTLATSGTVMLAALPVILGFQALVQFISYDILTEPKTAVHPLLISPAK